MQKSTELVVKVQQVQNQLTQGTFPRRMRGDALLTTVKVALSAEYEKWTVGACE